MTDTKIPLVAVLGHPIAHSKSPQLHGHWLKTYGIKGHYVPVDVAPNNLQEILRVMPKMGFVGANVTIPHKESVLLLADEVSDDARRVGAANTLVFRPDGTIHADNTDGYGFIENLRQNVVDWVPSKTPAAVLGAGGAARSIINTLLAQGVPRVFLSNRTRARANELRSHFGDRVTVVDWVQAGNTIEDASLIVNTTSLGMVGKPALRVPLDGLRESKIVCDLVYAPLKTDLLEQAESVGCRVIDGLGMLLHQAAPGFGRWFGTLPEVDAATRAAILR